MDWIKYATRLLVAGTMSIVAIAAVVAALGQKKDAGVTLGVGLVFGVAAFFVWPRLPNAWRWGRPTQRQLEYARDLGIRIRRGATKGEVSDLISQRTGR